MKTRLSVLSALIVAALGSTAALAAGMAGVGGLHPMITGTVDHRVPQLSNQYPYSAVGFMVSQGDNPNVVYFCTGTLVWHNLVLTAAHCMVNEKTGKPFNKTLFIPNLLGKDAFESAKKFVVTQVIMGNDRKIPGESEDDWAILTLDSSATGPDGYMDVQSSTEQRADGMTAVTYSPDYGNGMTAGVHESCGLLDGLETGDHQHFILTNCDYMPGGSGGPIFTWNAVGGRAVIRGVVHAHQEGLQVEVVMPDQRVLKLNGINLLVDAGRAVDALNRARAANPWPQHSK